MPIKRLRKPTPPINRKVSRIERGNIVASKCGQIFSLGEKLIMIMEVSGSNTSATTGISRRSQRQVRGRRAAPRPAPGRLISGFRRKAICLSCVGAGFDGEAFVIKGLQ